VRQQSHKSSSKHSKSTININNSEEEINECTYNQWMKKKPMTRMTNDIEEIYKQLCEFKQDTNSQLNTKRIQRSEWNKGDNAGYERWILYRYKTPEKSNWNLVNDKLNIPQKTSNKCLTNRVEQIEKRVSEIKDEEEELGQWVKNRKNQKNKMTENNTHLLILKWMLMDSIPTTKRLRMVSRIKKQYPTISCLQEMHLTDKDKPWLRVKG
jgi:hypothetical protein